MKYLKTNYNERFVASPLNYTGGKFKILEQIMPYFAQTDCFVDLFAGGANVGVNVVADKIILNDSNTQIVQLLQYFYTQDIEMILKEIDEIIYTYQLSNSFLYGYDFYHSDSSEGLARYNKKSYLNLRNDFNLGKNTHLIMLYVLIIYSFNNQIRFNRKGEFNLPVGKRDFNMKMRDKLVAFCERLKQKNIKFYHDDFKKLNFNELPKNTLIYCDPPYLITTASYNENGGWSEKQEHELLELLNKINEFGGKFALSNVLVTKGKSNLILQKWLDEYKYKVHFIDKNYVNSNYQRKDKSLPTVEVLITNY